MDLISGNFQHLSGDKRLSKAKFIRPQDRFRTDIPIKAGDDIHGIPGELNGSPFGACGLINTAALQSNE